MKFLIMIMVLMGLNSCQGKSDGKNRITSKNLVSKKYFVKGMTCGGCIIGVKTALNKSEELSIADKNIDVGEAVLKFEEKNYKEAATDCAVTKSIEKVTEFKVFLDKEHTKRACGS